MKHDIRKSFVAKTAAFILVAVSAFLLAFGGMQCLYLIEEGYYDTSLTEIYTDEVENTIWWQMRTIRDYLAVGNEEDAVDFLKNGNLSVSVMEAEDKMLEEKDSVFFTTYTEPYENVLVKDFEVQFPRDTLKAGTVIGYHRLYADKDYIFRAYINLDFPVTDELSRSYQQCVRLYAIKDVLPWVVGASVLLGFAAFLFLMCSAGHQKGKEELQESVLKEIQLDLYTVIFFIGAAIIVVMTASVASAYDLVGLILLGVGAAILAVWTVCYLREAGLRIKLGGWWKNTVLYQIGRLCGKLFGKVGRGLKVMLCSIPLIWKTVLLYLGISFLEFCVLLVIVSRNSLVAFWLLEKGLLALLVIYFAMMSKRIYYGSRELAAGSSVSVDTRYMYGEFLECGENLNSIGEGIAREVEERMKSERLKTELITNVSHDLKTPLTSIINYADLIAQEQTENEKITEYSEVLVRQSAKLKKLLEDLLEASKATTGNLEVHLQPCEISVILSQAVGEYQQKMEEKKLELVVQQPEKTLQIQADGRHLWRIFDNLLNNIYKYAKEDSRVYLTVEERQETIAIIFRNMSKYALNISAEELQERFVRGDKSRHEEGNGLGLSIARSLTELQKGQMEIVTDGDLFKVTVSFPKI